MSTETIRQIDLFSGEVVDNRTRAQKQADREREKPQQTELFAQREIAQFGVRANPHLPLSEHTKLVLIREDPRTEEETEHDRINEAQKLTHHLFPDTTIFIHSTPQETHSKPNNVETVFEQTNSIIGYRALHRQLSIHVRRRQVT